MDEKDRSILKIIQESPRLANAEVARQVGMAPSAVLERVRKLEERGIIEGYAVKLSARALGLGLLAFVFVRADERVGSCQTALLLAKIPEVQEVHHIAGEDCYLVKVRVADTEALGRLLRDEIGAIRSVQTTRSTIVLQTLKETTDLFWPDGPPAERASGGGPSLGSGRARSQGREGRRGDAT